MRILSRAVLMAAMMLPVAAGVQAQTRADSAAVLLEAADQLRQRGEAAAARAVLALIADRYAGTPAAAEVNAMLAALRGAPAVAGSGRTELLVWSTTYGTLLGFALPFLADADGPEAYGLGLLLGAPAGFLVARRYANAAQPSDGQTRAITFGGSWGTYQGFGWAEYLDLGQEDCRDPSCFDNGNGEARARVGAAVLGGLAGIGTGAILARKPITAGTAAAVSLGGMWGTWFGFAGAVVAGVDDGDHALLATLLAGNKALVWSALRAPSWQLTESRARLISIGGVIGLLGGGGLVLIAQPDNEQIAMAFPLVGSIAGLAIAARRTRTMDDFDASGRGALLNRDARGWGVGTPAAGLRLERTPVGMEPALHVPLLRVQFD
ncbi:hypothetical protein BH23GEM10_BH23GEM10_11730 [soil metagenome]